LFVPPAVIFSLFPIPHPGLCHYLRLSPFPSVKKYSWSTTPESFLSAHIASPTRRGCTFANCSYLVLFVTFLFLITLSTRSLFLPVCSCHCLPCVHVDGPTPFAVLPPHLSQGAITPCVPTWPGWTERAFDFTVRGLTVCVVPRADVARLLLGYIFSPTCPSLF